MSFAAERAQGLAGASPSDLAEIEITPSGYGLHWPRLDADLWLPALLEGVFGSRAWMAARLGAEGGKATSDAKVAAARENGKRGGQPKRARKAKTVRKAAEAKRTPAQSARLLFPQPNALQLNASCGNGHAAPFLDRVCKPGVTWQMCFNKSLNEVVPAVKTSPTPVAEDARD